MSKHTPGPWTTHHLDASGSDRVVGNGWVVAECSVMQPDSLEQRANARLIAAAPELLEALQWAMSQPSMSYTRRIKGQNEAHCDAIDKARAAIAKATGEQP